MQETNSDYITPQAVSQITGVCVTKVYLWIKEEQFPSICLDSKYHIPKTAFLKWWQDPDSIIAFKKAMLEKKNE